MIKGICMCVPRNYGNYVVVELANRNGDRREEYNQIDRGVYTHTVFPFAEKLLAM